jgi:hypothetical protein
MKATLLKSIYLISSLVFCFSCKNSGDDEPIVPSGATLQFTNLDKFPADDHLTFSRIEIPWQNNANHDKVTLRLKNSGVNPLIISNLKLSDAKSWNILTVGGNTYIPETELNLAPNQSMDVVIKFVASFRQNIDEARAKLMQGQLKIISNADNARTQIIYLHAIWQPKGENGVEPYTQEIIEAHGFKTSTGFSVRNTQHASPIADEVYAAYWMRADNSKPIYVRQMAAYHSCCDNTEAIKWQAKGSPNTSTSILRHDKIDGQSLLPRKVTSLGFGEANFSPTKPFSLSIGDDNTNPELNSYKKTDGRGNLWRGVRAWVVKDWKGNVIPNTYIFSHDYLSSTANLDYNDNVYYISNIKPE